MDTVWQSEDSLREKKVESDLKDLLKTLVAFANSVGPNDTAQIFIGEKDDGTVQGVSNTDNIQKSIKAEADKIYPEIYYKTDVYERQGKQCVRVDIKNNGLAPHFGGAAWVRRGSVTVKATEELFDQMIAVRQSKVRVLFQWLDKDVTIEGPRVDKFDTYAVIQAVWSAGLHDGTISFVNQHWVTFKVWVSANPPSFVEKSEPVDKLMLSWDHERKRPKVIVLSVD